jgi:hypothetical protein
MGRMSDRAIELQEHTEYAIGSGARNDEEIIAYVKLVMKDFSKGDGQYIKGLTLEYFGETPYKLRECYSLDIILGLWNRLTTWMRGT